MAIKPHGVVVSNNPAVNTEVSMTLLADTEVSLIKIPFVTDANVANRTVNVIITIGSDIIYNIPINTDFTASATNEIYIGGGMDYSTIGTYRFLPLPHRLPLPRGTVITTSTSGLQIGDNFGSAIVFGNIS